MFIQITIRYIPDSNRYIPITIRYIPDSNRYIPNSNRSIPDSNWYIPIIIRYILITIRYIPVTIRYIPIIIRYIQDSIWYIPIYFTPLNLHYFAILHAVCRSEVLCYPYNLVHIMERNTLIKRYFGYGLSQIDILTCLAQTHGVIISQRHLRRHLKDLGLRRRSRETSSSLLKVHRSTTWLSFDAFDMYSKRTDS